MSLCPVRLKDAIEQIALEGSDGMTIECLLYRLNHNPKGLDLLKILPTDKELTFWELDGDRFLPQFPVRACMTGSDSLLEATCADEKDQERDPYLPPKPVLKKNITKEIRDNPVEYFTNPLPIEFPRLVVMASARQRFQAIIKDTQLTESHLHALDAKSMFLVEKITRSREAGCLQSILNKIKIEQVVADVDEEKNVNTHVQYLIRPLEEAGILSKQQYAYRLNGKPRHQVLVMLARFQRDYRTKHKVLSERIVEILKNAPGYRMSMIQVKNELRQYNEGRRIPDDLFKKIYQNLKNNETIDYCLNDFSTQRRVHTIGERDMFLTEKYVKEHLDIVEKPPKFFPLAFKKGLVEQVFSFAEYRGDLGFTQRDLMTEFLVGFGKLEARNIIRKLLKQRLIIEAGLKEDGKQKHQIYRQNQRYSNPDFKFSETPAFAYRRFLVPDGNDTNAQDLSGSLFDQRMKIILDYVDKEHVVPDYKFKDIVSIIRDEEKLSDYTVDRRTVLKAMRSLENNKRLHIHRERIFLSICQPDNELEPQPNDSDDEDQSIEATFYVSKNCDTKRLEFYVRQHRIRMEIDNLLRCEPSRRAFGRIQGEFDIPKFQRLKAVHLYFWHLAWMSNQDNVFDADVLSQKPTIYVPSGDWKEFVPPVCPPTHLDKGWINIGEAYLHVPLSIFRKFAPGAMIHFNDPTKRVFLDRNPNILLRHMPMNLRKDLFYGRQNLQSLYECLEKLAYMGLVSFESLPDAKRKLNGCDAPNSNCSPWFMSKDVLNVYMHKSTSVLDTRTCYPGYMFVKDMDRFTRLPFTFQDLDDISNFWSELQAVCTTTPLNKKLYLGPDDDFADDDLFVSRHVDNSKTAEQLRKEWIVEHIRRDDPEPQDTGIPPGPGNGAAGLSPWLFSHLDRNWVRKELVKSDPKPKFGPENKIVATDSTTWTKDKDGMIFKTTVKKRIAEAKKGGPQAKKRTKKNKPAVSQTLMIPKDLPSAAARRCHDSLDIDIILSKQMYAINDMPMAIKRTNFKPKEDEVLFHLKVASSVLVDGLLGVDFPGISHSKNVPWRDLVIPDTTLRDFLRRECGSIDKTSSACYRRLVKHVRYKVENKHDHMLDQLSNDEVFLNTFIPEAEEIGKIIENEAWDNGQTNWTSNPEFMEFFRRIYEYVKLLRMQHILDLPDFLVDMKKFAIREAFITPFTRETSRKPSNVARLYRSYGGAQTRQEVHTYVAENLLSNILVSSSPQEGGGFPGADFDVTKELLNFVLGKKKPSEIGNAIKWLVRAKMCKKKARTDSKSLALETVREFVEGLMEELVMNELSKAKILDTLIRQVDFINGMKIIKEHDQNSESTVIDNPGMPEFMLLCEGCVNNRLEMKNILPEKLLMLLLTEQERYDFEREAQRFSEKSLQEDDDAMEAAKKAKDHYKHLLVMRGCYQVVDILMCAEEKSAKTMNLIPSTLSVKSSARNTESSKMVEQFQATRYHLPEGGNPATDKRVMVRKLITFCNGLNYTPSSAKRLEIICLWVLQTLHQAGVPGLDISEVFEQAIEANKKFKPEDLADSIGFLTEMGYVFKLGIETEKCVHYKHAKEWFLETPSKSSIANRIKDRQAELISTKSLAFIQAWNDLDGGISMNSFGIIVCNIIDLIFSNPGVTQESLLSQVVHRICSPASILDLLSRLEKVQIIESGRVRRDGPLLPFQLEDDEESEVIYYECAQDALEKTTRLLNHISSS